jgi:biotin carboxylase
MADQAARIGPPPAAESYLSIEAIVAACREAGADAVALWLARWLSAAGPAANIPV